MTVDRRTFLTGAAATASVLALGRGTTAHAARHSPLFVAAPVVGGGPSVARFRVSGKWREITLHPSAHGRDGHGSPLSELVAVPAGATRIEVATPRGTVAQPPTYGIRKAPPFTDPVASFYGWGFPVVTRKGWGADEKLQTWGEPEYHPAQSITVHHSASPTGNEFNDYREAVRSMYRYHAEPAPKGQGWGDIGYHLIIDPNGVIYAGRDTGAVGPIFRPGTTPRRGAQIVSGGHVVKANAGNIGIVLIGDFTHTLPTPEAQQSLRLVLANLCRKLGIDPLSRVRYRNPVNGVTSEQFAISGHRDWAAVAGATECPGDQLAPWLPVLRATTAFKIANPGRVPFGSS